MNTGIVLGLGKTFLVFMIWNKRVLSQIRHDETANTNELSGL